MVESDGWVLAEIVNIVEELVAQRANLGAHVSVLNIR